MSESLFKKYLKASQLSGHSFLWDMANKIAEAHAEDGIDLDDVDFGSSYSTLEKYDLMLSNLDEDDYEYALDAIENRDPTRMDPKAKKVYDFLMQKIGMHF